MKERDNFEDVGIELSIIVKHILRKWTRTAYSTLLLLRIGTGGRLL